MGSDVSFVLIRDIGGLSLWFLTTKDTKVFTKGVKPFP